MIVSLREIEPFNVPPVDNQQAGLFMRHLTGNETFSFSGEKRPKSVMFYSVVYKYPRLCSAHGWLLSVDIDTFEGLCGSGQFTMEQIMKEVKIGSIGIDLGGDLSSPKLYSNP